MFCREAWGSIAEQPLCFVEVIAVLAALHFFGATGLLLAAALSVLINVLIARRQREEVPLDQLQERLDESEYLREIVVSKRPRR